MPNASSFVKPQSITYSLDGESRRWDMVESHSSVAILLYHRQLDSLILVRQFRPAVYVSESRAAAPGAPRLPLTAGLTFELCAGIVDKDKTLKEIAHEEILEETGFSVPLDSIVELTSFISAIGISGARQTMFMAEVDDSMKTHDGGGLDHDGEAIEVVALPMANLEPFLLDGTICKSSGLMFASMHFKHVLGKQIITG